MEEIRRSPVEVGNWNPIIHGRIFYIPGGFLAGLLVAINSIFLQPLLLELVLAIKNVQRSWWIFVLWNGETITIDMKQVENGDAVKHGKPPYIKKNVLTDAFGKMTATKIMTFPMFWISHISRCLKVSNIKGLQVSSGTPRSWGKSPVRAPKHFSIFWWVTFFTSTYITMELNCNSSSKGSSTVLRNSHSRFGPPVKHTHTLKKQKITTKSSKLQFWPKFVPNFEERLPRIRCHWYQRLQYVGRDKGRYYWWATPRLHEVFVTPVLVLDLLFGLCLVYLCTCMVCFFCWYHQCFIRHMYKSLLNIFLTNIFFCCKGKLFAGLPPKDRREPCYLQGSLFDDWKHIKLDEWNMGTGNPFLVPAQSIEIQHTKQNQFIYKKVVGQIWIYTIYRIVFTIHTNPKFTSTFASLQNLTREKQEVWKFLLPQIFFFDVWKKFQNILSQMVVNDGDESYDRICKTITLNNETLPLPIYRCGIHMPPKQSCKLQVEFEALRRFCCADMFNHFRNWNHNNNNNNNAPTPRPRALLPSCFPLELRWNVYFHSLQAVFSSLVRMLPRYCKNHHILMIGSCFFVQYLYFFYKKNAKL